jgi:hypothetical protein
MLGAYHYILFTDAYTYEDQFTAGYSFFIFIIILCIFNFSKMSGGLVVASVQKVQEKLKPLPPALPEKVEGNSSESSLEDDLPPS